jgi:hypothetical protein
MLTSQWMLCTEQSKTTFRAPYLGIKKEAMLPSLFHALACLRNNGHGQQLTDADTGLSCPQKQNALLVDRLASHTYRTQQRRQSDACSALDVVIEAAELVPILLENSTSGHMVTTAGERHQTSFDGGIDCMSPGRGYMLQ